MGREREGFMVVVVVVVVVFRGRECWLCGVTGKGEKKTVGWLMNGWMNEGRSMWVVCKQCW